MVTLWIRPLVDARRVHAIDPLDGDACVGCSERERIFAVGTPWCVDGENSLELCFVSVSFLATQKRRMYTQGRVIDTSSSAGVLIVHNAS